MTADTHLPEVVWPEEWLAARKDLLVKEKEATRARDRVNADRRRQPPRPCRGMPACSLRGLLPST
jgi:predicted dithiol-disulfide oxidoreductase (DUF899 family)